MAQMAILLPTLLAAGTAGLQFSQQMSAADIQNREARIAAKTEEVGAIQREADRKERLVEAMASQTASAGSRGIAAFEGSPLTVLNEDIRREEMATERDIFNTRMSSITTRARGKIGAQQTRAGAVVGLLGDITKIAPTMKTKKD